MKRIFLMFCLTFGIISMVSGQTLPDEVRIDYICYKKSLDIVIKEISNRSGVKISFASNRVQRRRVTINAKNETLETILTVILDRTRLSYEVVGDQIVIVRTNSRRRPKEDPIISGYLTDRYTGEKLVGANVYLSDNSYGTITNEYGFFSIQMRRGTYRLQFSYVGYDLEYKQFFLGRDTTVNISLEPKALLNDVLITDSRETFSREPYATEDVLSMDELSSTVSLGGETDIIRLVNILPGVSSGAEGLGGINIRGGSADQNLVLLDGVPVYNASHALGVLSIFNSNIVKSAKVLRGSFPARYGGRLSSVIDVRTKDGGANRIGGEVSLSTLAAKAYLEGPIAQNHSFMFSARRTFIDPWLKEVTSYLNEQNGNEGFADYSFYDLNGKLNFSLSESSSLILSAYRGGDGFSNNVTSFEESDSSSIEKRDDISWDWGNDIYYLRYNNQFGKKAFYNLTAYYSKYQFSSYEYDRFTKTGNQENIFDYNGDLFKSNIEDIGVNFDLDWYLNTQHRLKLGFSAIDHTFNPGLIQVSDNDGLTPNGQDATRELLEGQIRSPRIKGLEINGYIEDELTLGEGVMANLGLNTQFISTESNSYINIQPRISLIAQSKSLFWKGGLSKMAQYLHLLSSNGLGLPSDVWIPSTDLIEPSSAWIADSEVGINGPGGIQVSVGGFYKTFDNISSYSEGSAIVINNENDWQSAIPAGGGSAYGAEFSFNKQFGRTTWISNYTYSQSTRTFQDLNNGRTFDFKFDRRHNVKLSFLHRITDQAEFTLNWNYASGTPYSEPRDFQLVRNDDGTLDLRLIYLEKNNASLPSYQRLDVAFNLYADLGWARQKVSIGIYNLLNKKNPFFIDIDSVEGNIGAFEARQYSVFPIFPSIAYSLAF